MNSFRWTSADLELLPEDGNRYEIIDGDLYVSDPGTVDHQLVCTRVGGALAHWCMDAGTGFAVGAPGVIFAEDEDVAPDVVWVSAERLPMILGRDGHLHGAPELVVEVLSPGESDEHREREIKLKLYARRGVREYWIVSWERRQVEFYRRKNQMLDQVGIWLEDDVLQSPLLPGFSYPLRDLFRGFPLPQGID